MTPEEDQLLLFTLLTCRTGLLQHKGLCSIHDIKTKHRVRIIPLGVALAYIVPLKQLKAIKCVFIE